MKDLAGFKNWTNPLRNNDGSDPEDIFWIGIEPHIQPVKEGEIWHRGQTHNSSRIGHISWWTRNKQDADFYTHGTGEVYSAEIKQTAKIGTLKDLVKAVRETNTTRKEIHQAGGFGGDNDFLYVPKVQEHLKKKGFDAILLSDPMMNYEIDALIVLNQKIINPR